MSEEEYKPETSWEDEAIAVIKDVQEFVTFISISKLLKSDLRTVYINLKTFEEKEYCVELNAYGFRIVGQKFDDTSEPSEIWFDTPYALLASISDSYNERFAVSLAHKLQKEAEKLS